MHDDGPDGAAGGRAPQETEEEARSRQLAEVAQLYAQIDVFRRSIRACEEAIRQREEALSLPVKITKAKGEGRVQIWAEVGERAVPDEAEEGAANAARRRNDFQADGDRPGEEAISDPDR